MCQDKPSKPEVSTQQPLQEALAAAGWTSWGEAALGPSLRYLWGSPFKFIPDEWRAYNEDAKTHFPLGRYQGFTFL